MFFLEAGAKIDASDVGSWTPLLWACYQSHLDIVDALISSGADVNNRGQYHASGLLWAAGRGDLDIVQLLLDNGCKVRFSKWTARHHGLVRFPCLHRTLLLCSAIYCRNHSSFSEVIFKIEMPRLLDKTKYLFLFLI